MQLKGIIGVHDSSLKIQSYGSGFQSKEYLIDAVGTYGCEEGKKEAVLCLPSGLDNIHSALISEQA
jgi:hypothetical protein